VSYELLQPGEVMIAFYSLSGKKVKHITSSTKGRGLYNKLINVTEAGLSPGLYLIVLQIDGKTRVKRVVIQ
jgi:hypothetical protein